MAEETHETTPSGCCTTRKRRIAFGVVGLLVVAVIIVLVAVFATRPKNLELTESDAVESLPSLIKGAMIGSNGAIVIEFTELLEDNSMLFYYVALNGDLDAFTIEEELGLENPVLYLIPDIASMESLVRIGPIHDVSFPVQLPESVLPGDFDGLVLAEKGPLENDTTLLVPFQIVDATRDIASPTQAPITPSPTRNPTGAPTVSPMPSVSGATRAPTVSPTKQPARAPIPPTNAPVVPPTSPPLPKVLVGTLEGEDYDVDGTITIDYVTGLKGGQVINLARLRFDVAAVRGAPGPYLYLSKRPFSETEKGDLIEEDIGIEIDEVNNGAFTMDGMFEQLLDEIGDVQDLRDYEGGSFIIWCRPFGVWLGGGPIEASN